MLGIRIAFAEQMRSGKDTSADYIKEKHLIKAKTFSFAEPLYDLLYLVQSNLNLPQEKNREFLQYIGSWGRAQNSNIWIDKLMSKILWTPPDINIIITDARYLNELQRLKQEKFIIIKLEADEKIRIERGASNLGHISELEFDLFTEYDYIVKNNLSFEQLYNELDEIMKNVQK